LNHSIFVIADCGHGSFFWNVLALQTVDFIIAAPFPTCKWSGKIGRALKLLINKGMPCNLFAVVKGQRLTRATKGWSLSTMAELTNSAVFFSNLTI
jgi:hypothetical protein